MGWKSTRVISREDAISAIIQAQDRKSFEEMSNDELDDMMCGLGIGDNFDLPYYGHNFIVFDTQEEVDEWYADN